MEELDSSVLELDGRKIVESGLLYRLPKLRFGVIFEAIPVWLATLDHSFVENISFPLLSSMEELIDKVQMTTCANLFSYIIQSFERNLYKFNQDLHSCNLLLISGSISFFDIILKKLKCDTFLFTTEKHTKVRHIPSSNYQLHRASHGQFGGPTKFQTLYAMSKDNGFFITPTIRRNLSSFIDFGLRPTSVVTPQNFVDQNSIVHPKMLHFPIRYASSFSATGFGFRCLTSDELGRVFGLPAQFLTPVDTDAFCFTPIQILDSIFRQFVQHHFGSVKLKRPNFDMLPTPSPVLESAPVYLASLQRVLPQDWRTVDIVEDKAAKADDAAVPLYLWNKRITCFWPDTDAALDVLRKFFLRIHFRTVFRAFCTYIRTTYPTMYFGFLGSRFSLYASRFNMERLGGV